MPRKNAIACRYLVSRLGGSPAVRTYCYFRRWDEELAAFIKGKVTFDWKAQGFDLAGKSQIKISLKTCDHAIARDRWAPLHAQVETALSSAQRARRHAFDRATTGGTEIRISTSDIATMAEQRRFDLIETAERQWQGETRPSPIRRILDRAAASGDRRFANLSPAGLQREALLRERTLAQKLHDDGDLERYEFAIRESDVDAAPPVPLTHQDLCGILGPEDFAGLVADGDGRQTLNNERVVSQKLIQSPAHEALAANGFNLKDDITNHRQVAFALWRSEVETRGDLVRRAKGQRIDVPPTRPAIAQPPTRKNKKTLDDLLDDWIESDQPAPKTQSDGRLYVRRFKALHGDLDVREIGGEHIIDFRRGLLSFPRVVPAHLKGASFKTICDYGATLEETKRLDRRSVNKAIGVIGSLLKTAQGQKLVDRNVAAGCRLKIGDKAERKGKPFTIEELNRLLASAIFLDPAYRPLGGGGEAAFWLPLLAMFTGARLEELGQLLISDVKTIDGIVCLSITDIPDDETRMTKAEANRSPAISKTVKTEAARRIVPLHPTLIDLGFLRYVEKIKAVSKNRLFPELRSYRGKVTKNFSRFINRYIDNHVTKNPKKNFHSLRHGAIDAMRGGGFQQIWLSRPDDVPTNLSEAVGHADASTTALYGLGTPVQMLHREICKLKYPGLSLTEVRPAH